MLRFSRAEEGVRLSWLDAHITCKIHVLLSTHNGCQMAPSRRCSWHVRVLFSMHAHALECTNTVVAPHFLGVCVLLLSLYRTHSLARRCRCLWVVDLRDRNAHTLQHRCPHRNRVCIYAACIYIIICSLTYESCAVPRRVNIKI